MNRIKRFEQYIKEELSPDTYVRAAIKSRSSGKQIERDLVQHAANVRRNDKADSRAAWVKELEEYTQDPQQTIVILTDQLDKMYFDGNVDGQIILTPPSDGDVICERSEDGVTINISGVFRSNNGVFTTFRSIEFLGPMPERIQKIISDNVVCR